MRMQVTCLYRATSVPSRKLKSPACLAIRNLKPHLTKNRDNTMAPRTAKLDPREQAIALLEKLDITKAPVPVEKIAKHLGAQVRFSPFDNEISGMIHIREGKAIIGINSMNHPHRQRFSIAHELGHLVLHRSLVT